MSFSKMCFIMCFLRHSFSEKKNAQPITVSKTLFINAISILSKNFELIIYILKKFFTVPKILRFFHFVYNLKFSSVSLISQIQAFFKDHLFLINKYRVLNLLY